MLQQRKQFDLMYSQGFTLLELLVTISIIALLASMMLPALAAARQTTKTATCLSNIRNMEVAHWIYLTDHDGHFVDVGLGGIGHDAKRSWINTLEYYYGSKLLHRSPVDDSPYWDTPGDGGALRQTSYGINNYLVQSPGGGIDRPTTRLEHVPDPSGTVHFLYMSEADPVYALADHPHIERWDDTGVPAVVPLIAASQLETNAHGGKKGTWEATTNYGFLDGHAATLKFQDVYEVDGSSNSFNPITYRSHE